MFGFTRKRNRKKFNGSVDTKVNQDYGILTRNNPKFPRVLAYLELLDIPWRLKTTEDEAAMYIAALYCCGLTDHGEMESAKALKVLIEANAVVRLDNGTVSEERWSHYRRVLNEKIA